jgi:hypothetical protein
MPPVVKSGPRYNATVQFPSLEDYAKLKVLAAHMKLHIGPTIMELVHGRAREMGINLSSHFNPPLRSLKGK